MDSAPKTAGDVVREYLAAKGWGQADLAHVVGKTTAAINEIIQGKREISAEMAALFAAAFGNTAEFWLTLDPRVSNEKLAYAKRRARLFELAPVREMIRRGWINPSDDLAELENELKKFFGVDSFDNAPTLPVVTRRSEPMEPLTPSQLAWCFKARNLAADIIAPPYSESRFPELEAHLKELVAQAPSVKRVAKTLFAFGIRFVIVQPLTDLKIDGAAMWLDENKPVIAMSLRMDRIDSFWFTLLHECMHIKYRDGLSVDSNLTGEDADFSAAKPAFERRADADAAAAIIPQDQINSFIKRIAPLYSKEQIIQFANRIRVHPGIIVGQLQHRGEIRFSANREMLVKIREKVLPTSVVDGWGNTIA